jgi:hypothetical protein
MPKKHTTKRHNNKKFKTKKQKVLNMKGCSKMKDLTKKNKKNTFFSLAKCKHCGPNCYCGPNCNCPPKCPGNCGLNKPTHISKGGAGCGNTLCPIASYPMNGGCNCGLVGGRKHKQSCMCSLCKRGGSFYKPAAPIPGPFIGQPWTPLVPTWPGVDGVSSNRNYLEQNMYKNDPQTMMKLQSGGGIIPQDLVNLGRNLVFNAESVYNALNGYEGPPNPLPYKDQLLVKR